ncbi:hypothetical protein GJ496_003280 [Pomphorhynchus laevis]|nr:hypothetical protein GJ496_003280 [Pomphorhynchus laevis]
MFIRCFQNYLNVSVFLFTLFSASFSTTKDIIKPSKDTVIVHHLSAYEGKTMPNAINLKYDNKSDNDSYFRWISKPTSTNSISLDDETGWISIVNPFSYNDSRKFNAVVEEVQKNTGARMYHYLSITVATAIPNAYPKLQWTLVESTAKVIYFNESFLYFSVNEPILPQTIIATIVIQIDNPNTLIFSFLLQHFKTNLTNDDISMIELTPNMAYALMSNVKLHRQNRQKYKMQISLTEDISFHICLDINNANDNWPRFEQPIYEHTLSRISDLDRQSLIPVLTVHAKSPSSNEPLQYYLRKNEKYFTINQISGNVFLNLSSWQQSTSSDNMLETSVHVVDSQNRNATSFVRIKINSKYSEYTDVHYLPEYHFDVYENVNVGECIGQVDLHNWTKVYSNSHYYTLVGFGNEFAINTSSGIIYTVHKLDRELKDVYNLSICDAGVRSDHSKSQQGCLLVTIKVLDVNDNSPTIVTPANHKIIKGACNSICVSIIKTIDPDNGVNGTVSISMETHRYFKIFNGCIYCEHVPPGNYLLRLIAFDHGMPRRYAYSEVTIQIQSENIKSSSVKRLCILIACMTLTIMAATALFFLAYMTLLKCSKLNFSRIAYKGPNTYQSQVTLDSPLDDGFCGSSGLSNQTSITISKYEESTTYLHPCLSNNPNQIKINETCTTV